MAAEYATLAFLTARFDVECLTPAAVEIALEDAEGFVDVSAFGCRADQAHALYAMHLLACRFPNDLGGEQGPVTALSANEISASFAVATPSESSTSTTVWGRMFEQICGSIVAPYVVG